MDSHVIQAVLTQATFWLCVALFVRLFTFRRRGARFRRDMSCLAWLVMVAAGSVVGGYLGGRFGRRLPPTVLRTAIVLLGCVAIVVLLRR